MNLQVLYCLLFLSLSSFAENPKEGDGDLLQIEITRQTTQEELQKIQQILKEKGVDLQIQQSTYNTNHKLTAIRLQIDFGNGKPKKYAAKNFKKFSIVLDGREGAKQPFCIGGNCV